MVSEVHAPGTELGSRWAIALIVLGAVQAIPAQSSLPRLERVTIPALESIGPERAGASVAVSASGIMAFTGGFDQQNRVVTVVDNTGRLLARVGPPGNGPGELTIPVQLAFAGRELVTLELGARRLSRFSLDGALQASAVAAAPIMLAAPSGDSIEVFQWPTSGAGQVLDFRRISPRTQEGRMLLSGQSSSLRKLASEGRQQGMAVAGVLYVSAGSAVIAANVSTNRLLGIGAGEKILFEHRGRQEDAPPGETTLSAVGGLQVDGKERIWAIGPSQRTGRTAAEVYSGPRVLGRIDLPCRGSVALAGSWLAILCDTPESASHDVSLQLYRIVDEP